MSKEQRAQVDAMLRQPRPEGPRSIEAIRAGFEALMAQMIVPEDIRAIRTTLGKRPGLRVEPDNGRGTGTILYLHGGGWVYGSPESVLSLTGHLVAKTGFEAYSVDYRLAPEHPFPAAIDDALSAYRALLDSGRNPSTIAFAGDSAGGGLTVTTCLAARDAGLPLPAALVMFSPGKGLVARCQADGAAHLSDAKFDEDDDVRVEGMQSAADCAGPVVGTFARVAFTWAVAH